MKNILFCGGSHLAHAKKVIEKKFRNYDIEFYVTAGPKNRDWSIKGGRYKVNGNEVGGNFVKPDLFKDLSKYEYIVFVGQWIQINRYLIFLKKQMLSKSILSEIFNKNCFINIPGNIYNEPLEIFPKLAPNKIILIPDPLVKITRLEYITSNYIDYFYRQLHLFCESKSIKIVMPDKSLLDDIGCVKAEYMRDKKDIHCTREYWEILFEKFNYF